MINLLEGVRVIESAVLFNGDQTGRLMGDLGADVIKVESPGVGDYLRDFLGQITPHNSPAHLLANRNKRSITLNLREAEGRDVFFQLLKTADIFVDGFAADACDRLGIGYEAQRRVKPDIIYCQCSGYGAGPYEKIPTHGQMMGALTGQMPMKMCDDGLVRPTGEDALADGTMVGASYAVMTALAALIHRDRTGAGARIDAAGSDAALSTMWFPTLNAWNEHRLTDRKGLAVRSSGDRHGEQGSAKYQVYQTKDEKFLIFCCIEHKFWDNFCRAVDRPDLLENKNEEAPVDFGGGELALRRELQSIFHTRTLAEWVTLAVEHDIAMGPCHLRQDLLTDPHLESRQIVHEEQHPDAGPFSTVGWPAPVADQRFEVFRPAPRLSQHTEEVLGELGLSSDDIGALRQRKII
jgi:formyl-CoA transferase